MNKGFLIDFCIANANIVKIGDADFIVELVQIHRFAKSVLQTFFCLGLL